MLVPVTINVFAKTDGGEHVGRFFTSLTARRRCRRLALSTHDSNVKMLSSAIG